MLKVNDTWIENKRQFAEVMANYVDTALTNYLEHGNAFSYRVRYIEAESAINELILLSAVNDPEESHDDNYYGELIWKEFLLNHKGLADFNKHCYR